jgi:hypothetical protein
MKLKINITFIKISSRKFLNQNNKDQNRKNNK